MAGTGLNAIFLEQNCRNVLKTCNFNGPVGANCASQFCHGFPTTSGTCVQLGFDPYNCCGSSAPASCIAAHYSSGSAIPTPNVCASILSILIDCSSIAPSLFPSSMIYTAGPHATALAGCMCYDDDGTYDPDVVDDFASECVASGSAAHPTYYKYGTLFQGFCTNNAGPITASASSTPVVVSTTPQTTPASAGSASVTSASATPVSASATPASASASQQPPTTSANPGSSSTVPLSVAVSTPTSPPASTTTSKSGAVKNSFKTGALLLGIGMLFSVYC